MIKSKEGSIRVKGTKTDLVVDLVGILTALERKSNLTREDIDFCLEVSRLSEEEQLSRITTWLFVDLFKNAGEGDNDGDEVGN